MITPTPAPVLAEVTTILASAVPTSINAAVLVASVLGVIETIPTVPPVAAAAAVNLVARAVVPTPKVAAAPSQTVVTNTVISKIWLFAGITIVVAPEA